MSIGPYGSYFIEIWNQNTKFFFQQNAFENVCQMSYLLFHHKCVNMLTYLPWCRIYASINWVIIADIFSIWPLGTNFSEIWIEILILSLKKMCLKMSSAQMAAILSRGRWVNTTWEESWQHMRSLDSQPAVSTSTLRQPQDNRVY